MLDFCLRIIKPCWCLFGGIDGTRVSWFVVCFLLFLFKSLFWNMRDIHLRAAAASFLSHDQTRVLLLDEILQGVKSKCLLASASCVSASESSNVSLLCKDVAGCRGGSATLSCCRMEESTLGWWKSAWRLLRILSCVILTEPWLPPPPPHPPLTFSHLDSSGFAC